MEYSDEWLSINEVTNGLDSLETAAYLIDRTESTKWKWIAIAIHHSLYSLCVSALNLGNPSHVLIQGHVGDADKKRFMKKSDDIKWKKSKINKIDSGPGYVIKWEYTEDEPPQYLEKDNKKQKKEKLIGFWTALARVQDQEFWMGRQYHTRAVSLTADEWQNIAWLTNQVRNELICKKLTRCLQNLILSEGGFCRHEHAQAHTIDATRSPAALAVVSDR